MNDKYTFDAVSFGMRLSQLRKFNEKTQEQVAQYVNVSTKTVQNWEHGSKMPGIDNLVSLAECFNMSVGEILEDEAYRIFWEKAHSRKRSIEIIEVKNKIEVFMEFCEDRFFDRYELWVWDELANYKYLYQSVQKLVSYADFKRFILDQSDNIVDIYRKWLFTVLTDTEEDELIRKAIEDKIKSEKSGMASGTAIWNGFGKILYFDEQ